MEDRIMTLHPAGKQGVNINREKYEAMKLTILKCLAQAEDVTYSQLAASVEEMMAGHFDGSVRWYFTTVKLDLEARHLIERTSSNPPLIRLTRHA